MIRARLQRLAARWRLWRNLPDMMDRRTRVEQYLFDCAGGARPLPDAETCRLLALKLGTPSFKETIQLPKNKEG